MQKYLNQHVEPERSNKIDKGSAVQSKAVQKEVCNRCSLCLKNIFCVIPFFPLFCVRAATVDRDSFVAAQSLFPVIITWNHHTRAVPIDEFKETDVQSNSKTM